MHAFGQVTKGAIQALKKMKSSVSKGKPATDPNEVEFEIDENLQEDDEEPARSTMNYIKMRTKNTVETMAHLR